MRNLQKNVPYGSLLSLEKDFFALPQLPSPIPMDNSSHPLYEGDLFTRFGLILL